MKNKKSTHKILKIALGIVLLLVVAGVFLELTGVTDFVSKKTAPTQESKDTKETISYTPATEEEKAEVETNKTNDDKIKEPQNPADPAAPSEKTVTISSAAQTADKDVVVQTQLKGIGWQSCTLTLTQGARKVTKTAETLYQQSFSTCLGFSVPYSELNQAGTWQADLSVTNSDGQTRNAKMVSVIVAP